MAKSFTFVLKTENGTKIVCCQKLTEFENHNINSHTGKQFTNPYVRLSAAVTQFFYIHPCIHTLFAPARNCTGRARRVKYRGEWRFAGLNEKPRSLLRDLVCTSCTPTFLPSAEVTHWADEEAMTLQLTRLTLIAYCFCLLTMGRFFDTFRWKRGTDIRINVEKVEKFIMIFEGNGTLGNTVFRKKKHSLVIILVEVNTMNLLRLNK